VFCALQQNWVATGAHALMVFVLATQAQGVDLKSEKSIKQYYMLIWKLFYSEYLIMLLL